MTPGIFLTLGAVGLFLVIAGYYDLYQHDKLLARELQDAKDYNSHNEDIIKIYKDTLKEQVDKTMKAEIEAIKVKYLKRELIAAKGQITKLKKKASNGPNS